MRPMLATVLVACGAASFAPSVSAQVADGATASTSDANSSHANTATLNSVIPNFVPNAAGPETATPDTATGGTVSAGAGTADEGALWALLQPDAAAGIPDAVAITAKIVRSGPAAVAPIVSILLGDSAEPEVAYEVHPRAIEQRRQILVESLRQLPAADVIDGLRSRITARTGVDVRVLVIQLLSEVGGARAFEGAMGIAVALDPIQWQRAFVQVPIEESFVRFATRTPRLVRRFEQALSDADARFAPVLVRSLCATRVPTALHALPGSLGRDPALDLCILQELGKLGARFDPLADPDATARVRSLLDSPDPEVERAAAVALARMGDSASCNALIAKLKSEDPLTAASARWSLETLSGKKLGTDHETWWAWWVAETNWLDDELPHLTEQLLDPDASKVAAAIEKVVQHRVHRHDVALALRPVLQSENVAAQRIACDVLGRLGSPHAVPWLLEKLESPDENVRQAALGALHVITKIDLPLDVAGWRSALTP